MLPLDLGTNDVPIFVNPKQYHAIMKSRERRAKAELKKKTTLVRKVRLRTSMRLSRTAHLHVILKILSLGFFRPK